MKQTPRALLLGICFPVMMLIIFSLSACKAGNSSSQSDDGNANVNMGTKLISSINWNYPGGYKAAKPGNTTNYYSTKFTDIPAPEITEEIVKHGIVQVYFNPSDDGSFTALPYQLESIAHNYNFSFEYSKGNIRVHFFYSPNQNTGTMPSLAAATVKDYTFRYIVVPGAITVKTQRNGIKLSASDPLINKHL